MAKHYFIPRADVAFNDWQHSWFSGTKNNAALWHIDQMEVEDIEHLQAQWVERYHIAINPALRTSPAVLGKNEARKAYESAIRKFVREYQTYNKYMTDVDRINIGLPVHKTTRTPVPVPSTTPIAETKVPEPAVVEIHFRDENLSKKAKPFGVHGVEIAWAVLDIATTDWDDLTHSSFDTNSPIRLVFKSPQRGKTLYFALRWQNTRGEKGTWSNIQSVIIP
jgi:hypothetical protein